MKLLACLAVPALVLVAGCDDEHQVPTTVVVNTPPPDTGLSVLLTVMVGAAFVSLLVAAVFAWAWAVERRTRQDAERALRDAEDTVLALTGQPMERVRLSVLRRSTSPVSKNQALEGWTE